MYVNFNDMRQREYDPATDYTLLLDTVRRHGTEIPPVYHAFQTAGIRWPNLTYDTAINGCRDMARIAYAHLVDSEILRAWRELGLHP